MKTDDSFFEDKEILGYSSTPTPDLFDMLYDIGYGVVAISTIAGDALYRNVLKPGYEKYNAWVRGE